MLTSFGALYAGYIDMENAGYEGTPANDRWYANDRLCEVFDNARAMAQLVEKKGYDVFWTAEHHFQREGYECIPNVLPLNVYLASQTNRIKLGCAFNITPLWHPLGRAAARRLSPAARHSAPRPGLRLCVPGVQGKRARHDGSDRPCGRRIEPSHATPELASVHGSAVSAEPFTCRVLW
jgi:alkanesulfonate monooxygenase SsuD/methylene tetrahydromethanopterin reductase-like flavin-dependent oxidoreductase (luciferase family)